MSETFRIYVEPVSRGRLFNLDIPNFPKEVQIVWAWDVRGEDDRSREPGLDNYTTSSLAHGYSATEAEAHQDARQWADALAKKTSYTYTPKGK